MSTSRPDPQRVRPALRVRAPGSPAPGQGLAVQPHLWRDPEKSKGETSRQGAPKTTRRRYRLSGKVSVSVQRAHGNLGAQRAPAGLAECPKPGEGGDLSQAPRAPPLVVPARAPVLGSRVRERRVCVSLCTADTPLPGSPCRAPALCSGPGIPSPSAEIPARPLPTLPRRESGRAEDKETPASSTLGPSAYSRHSPAPSLNPRDVVRGHSGTGWVSLLPDVGQMEAAHAPRWETPHDSRAPTLRSPNRPGPPAPPPPATTVPHLSWGEIGGCGAHKAGWGERGVWRTERSRQGSARARAQLFTRFLLRSPRCLRR